LIVLLLTAAGTPAEARERVKHYIDNGATCPILYPLGDVRAMIDAFSGWNP
jgi:5,10-methylenetetrahydromethanopterin reductase